MGSRCVHNDSEEGGEGGAEGTCGGERERQKKKKNKCASPPPSPSFLQVKAYFDYVKTVRDKRAAVATAAALAGAGPPPTNAAELQAALGRMAGGLPRGVQLGGR